MKYILLLLCGLISLSINANDKVKSITHYKIDYFDSTPDTTKDVNFIKYNQQGLIALDSMVAEGMWDIQKYDYNFPSNEINVESRLIIRSRSSNLDTTIIRKFLLDDNKRIIKDDINDFSYNLDGEIEFILRNSDDILSNNSEFFWQNGNITKIKNEGRLKPTNQLVSGSIEYTIEYTDKENKGLIPDFMEDIGDFELDLLTFYGKQNKNLPSKMTRKHSYNQETALFSYTYDEQNRIKSIEIQKEETALFTGRTHRFKEIYVFEYQ